MFSCFIVLVVGKQVPNFFLSYNNHYKILGEGAFKINFLCFNAVVRRKLCGGVFSKLSHLKGL